MKRVDYLKEKLGIIASLLRSHSYIVITHDDMAGHVCTEEDMANMKNQIVLAGYKLERSGEHRAAEIVRE